MIVSYGYFSNATNRIFFVNYHAFWALLNDGMNSPPNPPFWGTLGLSKSLTCGGFRGRFRNVATHRFILGFSNAAFCTYRAGRISRVWFWFDEIVQAKFKWSNQLKQREKLKMNSSPEDGSDEIVSHMVQYLESVLEKPHSVFGGLPI